MEQRKSVKGNLFFLAVGLFILILIPFQITSLKVADTAGPRFFPYCAITIIMLPNAIQLICRLLSNQRAKRAGILAKSEEGTVIAVSGLLAKYKIVITVMLIALLSTFIVDFAGYCVTYSAMVSIFLAIFNEKRWYFYAISIALVLLVYLMFTKFLYVPLP